MEAGIFSEILTPIYQATQFHSPEEPSLQSSHPWYKEKHGKNTKKIMCKENKKNIVFIIFISDFWFLFVLLKEISLKLPLHL